MIALRRIEAELRALAQEIDAIGIPGSNAVDAFAHRLRVIARQVEAQAEMSEGGLVE